MNWIFNEIPKEFIENPVEIQWKFQWNINGNPFYSSWNFNEKPVLISKKHQWNSIGHPVEISTKYQWKSIWNWVSNSMKYWWKSIGNPVKIHLEIKLEMEIVNSIGNGNGHLKFNRNNKWNPFVISMNTCWYFNETQMEIRFKFQWYTNRNFNEMQGEIYLISCWNFNEIPM